MTQNNHSTEKHLVSLTKPQILKLITDLTVANDLLTDELELEGLEQDERQNKVLELRCNLRIIEKLYETLIS